MSLSTNSKAAITFYVILYTLFVISVCDVTSEMCLFGDGKDCAFPCHCSPGSQCDSWTGKCRSGNCKEEKSTKNGARASWKWRGPGCQTGNVAFNKKATSNDYSAAMREWVVDNLMTDGITRSSTRNCPIVSTESEKPSPTPAAWLIDLEKPHKINGFVLYVFSKNIGKVRVTVGNTTALSEHVTCSVLKNSRRIKKKLSVELNCSKPLTGRYVSVVKDPQLDDQIHYLELCEISVIGHIHYNVETSACMDSNFNGIWCSQCLDRLPPNCMMKCPKGRVGLNCESSCEPCSGPCNPDTGRCDDNPDGKGGTRDIPDDKSERNSTFGKQGSTTPGTLIDQVVFVTQEEKYGIIRDVTLGVEDQVTVDTNEVVHSVVQVQVGNSNQTKSSKTVTPNPGFPYTEINNKPMKCDFGYFGKECVDKCGSCLGGKTCDPEFGTCENGCEEWYINGETDCDTYISNIDLNEENILIFPTPYSFKIKLYGISKVDETIEEFYKGEVRAKRLDGPDNIEDDVLAFYPHDGSFMKELSISGLKENTQYILSLVVYRIHNGHTSAGNGLTIVANTSIDKPDVTLGSTVPKKVNMFSENSYTFFLLVAGFAVLLFCVTGVVLYLCIRSKKLKDGSSISTSDSRSEMSQNGGPVSLTKVEQDPIYQFIDDGEDLKYHVYHDIDELSKNCYPLWNDPKISRDDFTGSVHLIPRPPYKKQSYIPEINELEELRRRENLSFTDLSLMNNGYLTTGAVKNILPERSWSFSQQPERVPSVPRYVKTSHGNNNGGNRNRNSIPDRSSKLECDYLLPVQQQMPNPNNHHINDDMNVGYSQKQADVLPEYMMPVHRHQRHTGYIPMDANTPNQALPQRRGYFSCINNSPNNILDDPQGRRYPRISNDIISQENQHRKDNVNVRENHSSYVDMA